MNALPIQTGIVESVNISEAKGTIKKPVPAAEVTSGGLAGDAHAGPWLRQVSLLPAETVERFAAEIGRELAWGEFAENITTRGLDLREACPLDRFEVGAVELEVTQIGKTCHGDTCAIFREVGRCVMPKEGIFCRVTRGGPIEPGDVITYHPRALTVRVITLSDRASRGEYADRGGPRVEERLATHFVKTSWRTDVQRSIMPDDGDMLAEALEDARDLGVDVVVTTGSTGIGPRDIAPDVVIGLADTVIPGIMHRVRERHGADKPNVLLSRSVAAVLGTTLVYTLPGSVRAVDEYMDEIVKTLEHAILMIHGLGH